MFRNGLVVLVAVVVLSGCQNLEEQNHFRGLMVVGPHGPEFSPETDFTDSIDATVELYPWRMEGREPDFSRKIEDAERYASQLGLPSFPWIKVEFRGKEVSVSPNSYGVTRQIEVDEWIDVEPCQTEPRECLSQ